MPTRHCANSLETRDKENRR